MTRPVIGVPLNASLNGSTPCWRLPCRRAPVATVAIDGAANAAQLAVQILAVSDAALAKKLAAHKKEMADAVLKKAAAIA